MKPIRIIGLTGQTGAGKTTVSRVFSSSGLEVIDCDEVCHEVLRKEKQLIAELALEFGVGILDVDGGLNRRRLGEIVFNDRARLDRLNRIIFPYIREEVMRRVVQLQKNGCGIVVLDAPTLFESGLDAECGEIVSVIAPTDLRLNRIMVRDHLTDAQARSRIASQHRDEFYTERSTYVLNNNTDYTTLRLAAVAVVEQLKHGQPQQA